MKNEKNRRIVLILTFAKSLQTKCQQMGILVSLQVTGNWQADDAIPLTKNYYFTKKLKRRRAIVTSFTFNKQNVKNLIRR